MSIGDRLITGGDGNSLRDIEADYAFAVTKSALSRHKQKCMPEQEPIRDRLPKVLVMPDVKPEVLEIALRVLPAKADLNQIAHELLSMQYQNVHAVHDMVRFAQTPGIRAVWAQKSSDVVTRTMGLVVLIQRMELEGPSERTVTELQGYKDDFDRV